MHRMWMPSRHRPRGKRKRRSSANNNPAHQQVAEAPICTCGHGVRRGWRDVLGCSQQQHHPWRNCHGTVHRRPHLVHRDCGQKVVASQLIRTIKSRINPPSAFFLTLGNKPTSSCRQKQPLVVLFGHAHPNRSMQWTTSNFENYRLRVLTHCGWDGIINRV